MNVWEFGAIFDPFELSSFSSFNIILFVVFIGFVNTGHWKTAALCLRWQYRLRWCRQRRRWLRWSRNQHTLNSENQLAMFHCSSQPTETTANIFWNTTTCCSVIHSCFKQEFTSMTLLCFYHFCRAMLCISAAYAIMRCLSVRLFVRPSVCPDCLFVCPSRSCILSKRVNISLKFFYHLVGPAF